MGIQFSVAVRNAQVDSIETAIGASPTLELRTGVPPASCAAADTGTLLASLALPADWLSNASGGSKSLLGVWKDDLANAAGTVGHFRLKAGSTCHIQGTVTKTGEGGDLTLDNNVLAVNQEVSITNFTVTAGGA